MQLNPPKYLYRYIGINDHCRQLIQDNVLYFSSKRNFNDPFDSKIHVSYDTSREKDPKYLEESLDLSIPPLSLAEKNQLRSYAATLEKPIEALVKSVQ